MVDPADSVTVGVIGKAFGVHGEVYVRPDPDVVVDFAPGATYQAGERELVVAATREHSGRRLVHFEGVEDRDAAEELRGLVLAVERSAVTLEAGAFWAVDLVGLSVFDEGGQLVGEVRDVADGAAHDYLVVAGPAGEALVPVHEDLVEVTAERVVLHGPLDLLTPEEEG